MQGRFAALADRKALLRVKAVAERPNYRGNARARISNNLWQAILEGRVAPDAGESQTPAN